MESHARLLSLEDKMAAPMADYDLDDSDEDLEVIVAAVAIIAEEDEPCSLTGNIGQANYAASKSGVIGLTKTAAKEFARFNTRVNVILPGFIETPMTKTVPEKLIGMVVYVTPLQRMGKPEEIADACVFLASNKSSFITGAVLEVTGGLNM